MRLLPPEGLRSVEMPDGAVVALERGEAMDVPDAVAFEFLEAGWQKAMTQVNVEVIPGPPGPPGPPGKAGDIGPMPLHQWRDTELRFELKPGIWGKWTDLQGPPGEMRVTHASGGGSITKIIQGGTGTGDGSVPYFVPAGDTFTVPIYRQALFERTIDCEGLMDIEGDLIMVT